jgi:glycosyltransferase involved in cell wall biosynthesis
MRILHILLSKGFAGSERSTAESCNAQALQHTVGLVVRANHQSSQGQSVVNQLLPAVDLTVLPRWWGQQTRLLETVQTFKPDIIHCHLRRSTRLALRARASLDKLRASLQADIKRPALVATLHVEPNSPAYLGMDGLICNAQWQIEAIKAMCPSYKGLLFKAQNSVVPHPKIKKAQRHALREALGLGPDDFFVGAAGRYTHEKGFDQLIKAFKQVTNERLQLRVFGQGRMQASLKTLAGGDPRIEVLSFRNDIKDLYQAMDLFVCPSRWEPLPRVILEAMDAGTPVLASTAEGCKELIHAYEGDLFTIENIDELAEHLQSAIQKGPYRTCIDLSMHHIENANAAMEAFYADCIRHAKLGPEHLYNAKP